MGIADVARKKYAPVQKWYLDTINGLPSVKLLASGKLPYAHMQNIIYDFWLIVNNFPNYLESIAKRINIENPQPKDPVWRAKYRTRKWVVKNVKEEFGHKMLWKLWAKEFGISKSQLSKTGHTSQMLALHRYLVQATIDTRSSIYLPKALAITGVGVEGMTGALIYTVYSGIKKVYKLAHGKKMSSDARGWLDVHFKEDFDHHPIQALALILLNTPPEYYDNVMTSVRDSGFLYLSAFNAAASRPFPYESGFARMIHKKI